MAGYSTREFGKTGRKSGRRGLSYNVFATGAITASLAHELRQPLTAIAVNASAGLRWLDADRPRIDRARRSIMRVLGETDRAAKVISRMRVSATRGAAAETRRLSINAIVRRAVDSIDWVFRDGNTRLSLRLADRVPPVRGDAVQLQQLLHNLLTNAVEAVADLSGKPKRVVVVTQRGADATAVVTVRDSGNAVGAASLARAFEPFYTTKRHGMGLGLPICRSIVEAHGGRIWATPNRGGGAAFHFALPGARPSRRGGSDSHDLRRR